MTEAEERLAAALAEFEARIAEIMEPILEQERLDPANFTGPLLQWWEKELRIQNEMISVYEDRHSDAEAALIRLEVLEAIRQYNITEMTRVVGVFA